MEIECRTSASNSPQHKLILMLRVFLKTDFLIQGSKTCRWNKQSPENIKIPTKEERINLDKGILRKCTCRHTCDCKLPITLIHCSLTGPIGSWFIFSHIPFTAAFFHFQVSLFTGFPIAGRFLWGFTIKETYISSYNIHRHIKLIPCKQKGHKNRGRWVSPSHFSHIFEAVCLHASLVPYFIFIFYPQC